MDRRVDMPLSNLKRFWAEYGLVACMNQGREGRTNEQKHEETAYFSWHGEPPDDVWCFNTSLIYGCINSTSATFVPKRKFILKQQYLEDMFLS
jgi:hypothetical protein